MNKHSDDGSDEYNQEKLLEELSAIRDGNSQYYRVNSGDKMGDMMHVLGRLLCTLSRRDRTRADEVIKLTKAVEFLTKLLVAWTIIVAIFGAIGVVQVFRSKKSDAIEYIDRSTNQIGDSKDILNHSQKGTTATIAKDSGEKNSDSVHHR